MLLDFEMLAFVIGYLLDKFQYDALLKAFAFGKQIISQRKHGEYMKQYIMLAILVIVMEIDCVRFMD